MIARFARVAAVAITAMLITACADEPLMQQTTAVRVDYGTVEAIEVYRGGNDKPIDAGTVLGGIAGGVIGHQIGGGSGNTAATIAGAVGGAVVGHEVEKKANASHYRITVRLDAGSVVIVDETRDEELRIGDRVRVENNRVVRL